MKLGQYDVDGMLRRLTAKQFREWEHYAQLEPFGEIRDDWRAASIREMVHNVAVKREHQKPISDFVLKFEEEPKRRQTPEEQLRIAYAICMAYSVPAKDL